MKIKTFIKIAFLNKWIWPILICTWIFINSLNYLIIKYFYRLMVINPKYLFLWLPSDYIYNSHGNLEGPSLITSCLILFLVILVLYTTNYKKVVCEKVGSRSFIFFTMFFIICLPQPSNIPGVFTLIIDKIPVSPVKNFMKGTKRDYRLGIAETPLGTFKMYINNEDIYDNLFRRQKICRLDLSRGMEDSCFDYPYKK